MPFAISLDLFTAQTVQSGGADSAHALMSLLVNPYFAWLLVLLIVGLACSLWYRFAVTDMGRAINGLREGIKVLKRYPTKEEFVKNLESIDQSLLANPILGDTWNHYTDNLLFPPDRTSAKSGQDPQFYFNDSLLGFARINLRFYYAVPSYLVGIGLICTFVGLVAALFFASTALDQDIHMIQLALQNLLKAAAFKFTTSIVGLGSSLVFSYGMKRQLMLWQQGLDEFCSRLQTVAPVVSVEALSFETLAAHQSQIALLSRIHTELAGQFATALDAKLHANLTRLVDPISAEISQVTKRLAEVSQEAVKEMVREFRAQLLAASQEQMHQLLAGLQATTQSLEQMNTGITRSADHFGREIDRATEGIYQRISQASEAFATSLHPLHREINALATTFAAVDQRFKSQLDLFTAAVDGMHVSLQEFRKTAKVLEGVSTPIQRATQELDAVARRIRESNEASMRALDELAKFSNSLSKTAQLTQETWDIYRQRFEKVDDDLKGVVDQLGKGFRSYHQIVENFMKQLDQCLANSNNVLSASIQELAETLENIEVHTKRMNHSDTPKK